MFTYTTCFECFEFCCSDLKKRHQQMKLWIKQRMIPVFGDDDDKEPVSNGVLSQVWLGGLVNPSALFTALRHEKAVLAKCHIDQVRTPAQVALV